MKQFWLFFAIFASTLVYSQYIPMLQEGNTWSVDVHYAPIDPPSIPFWTVTEQITIGVDQTINGILYKQILNDDVNVCLLREENGVVYKYDQNNNIDRVLFDYSLETGDLFEVIGSGYDSYPSCANGPGTAFNATFTVTQVEYIEIAGMDRKVITFDYPSTTGYIKWIEGIGNITGFDFIFGQIDVTAGSNLVCFSTNGQSYFFNDATSCDNTTLSLVDVSEEEIVLYPNPVVQKSILQLPHEGYADTIRIYDLYGKLVKEVAQSTDHFVIDAMRYRSGRYFAQIVSQNKVIAVSSYLIR